MSHYLTCLYALILRSSAGTSVRPSQRGSRSSARCAGTKPDRCLPRLARLSCALPAARSCAPGALPPDRREGRSCACSCRISDMRIDTAVPPGQSLQLPADGKCSGVEVDMPPAQPQCLTLPQAECQRNAPPSAVTQPGGQLDDPLLHPASVVRSHPGSPTAHRPGWRRCGRRSRVAWRP